MPTSCFDMSKRSIFADMHTRSLVVSLKLDPSALMRSISEMQDPDDATDDDDDATDDDDIGADDGVDGSGEDGARGEGTGELLGDNGAASTVETFCSRSVSLAITQMYSFFAAATSSRCATCMAANCWRCVRCCCSINAASDFRRSAPSV